MATATAIYKLLEPEIKQGKRGFPGPGGLDGGTFIHSELEGLSFNLAGHTGFVGAVSGVDNQVAVWSSTNSIEGTTSFTWDGTDQKVGGNGQYLGDVLAYTSGVSVSWWDAIPVDGVTIQLNGSNQLEVIGGPSTMVYPGVGIALSTGTGWDTSITNNSANWNTAYGWGNHASAGYAPLASPTFTGTVTLPISTNIVATGGYKMFYRNTTVNVAYSGTTAYHINNNADTLNLFTVLDGGNVGIGTTTPLYKLHVEQSANAGIMKIGSTHHNRGILIGTDSTGEPGIQAVVYNSDVARQLSINAAGGNVGIGTTAPGVRFVNSGATLASGPTLGSGTGGANAILSANGLYGLYTGVSSNGDIWQQVQRNDTDTTIYNLLLQPSGGNVGIGTTAPGAALDVRSAYSHFGADGGNTYIGGNTLNFGNQIDANATGYINYSGYNHGATQFRDLIIGNGKNSAIATFTGSTSNVTFAGDIICYG